jgi:hypothetical protein
VKRLDNVEPTKYNSRMARNTTIRIHECSAERSRELYETEYKPNVICHSEHTVGLGSLAPIINRVRVKKQISAGLIIPSPCPHTLHTSPALHQEILTRMARQRDLSLVMLVHNNTVCESATRNILHFQIFLLVFGEDLVIARKSASDG